MPHHSILATDLLVTISAIPASALDEDFDEEDDEISGEERDDEKSGTRYNVSTFALHHGGSRTQFDSVHSTLGSMSSSSWVQCTSQCF